MEERRKRTPKKPEHPIREWISDYLRYFILIGGILLFLLIAFFLIRWLSGGPDRTDSASVSVSESVQAASESEPEAEEGDAEVAGEQSSSAEAEEESAAAEEMVQESSEGIVTSLVNSYFAGLSARDPEAVRACVDVLSEEDYQQVAENTQVTSYTDVTVYTFDGLDDSSKVAFVTYQYTVNGSDAVIPALTQFYAYDTGAGDWRLVSEPDEAAQQRMQALIQEEAVQNIISEVQAQYDQVLSEHPELQ